MTHCQLIENERSKHPIDLLCRTLGVSPARYYAWRKQHQAPTLTPPAASWQETMKQTFTYHKHCYGTRWLRVELHAQSHRLGRQRLQTAMRRHIGCGPCSPVLTTPRTTDATHRLRCAPNHLLDQPKPTQAN